MTMRPLSDFLLDHGFTDNPEVPHLIRLYEKDRGYEVASRDNDGVLQMARPVSRGALAGWVLHLPWEKNPIPANKPSHGHWAQTAAAVRMVRETARMLSLRHIPPQAPGQIRIRLDWEVVTRRDRDEDNLVLTMKALTDGLRLAMVVPKDTREFVLREMPEINYSPKAPGRPAAFMRLHIHRVTV